MRDRSLEDTDADARLAEAVRRWHVSLDRVVSTEGSLLGFGRARDLSVVLKVTSSLYDEPHACRVLKAFDGHGMVRPIVHASGAVLMPELKPGTSLVDLVLSDGDEVATDVLLGVVAAMKEVAPDTTDYPTARDWAGSFSDTASLPSVIRSEIVLEARQVYEELVDSQGPVRLLHGDLQHSNVVLDSQEGWTAIDPKGVVAELEFELGAAMRNPLGMPHLYESGVIERRAKQWAEGLEINEERLVKWTFAQAVLSALWTLEDGGALNANSPALQVAAVAREILA